ncbi:thiamine biosynthesis protein ApbE [Pseudomonas aeruginosa]|uniref:FAD:protein FMN transferase n=1 Tax=Pseudomonas aeruginosa TaxID=287 RepID=UPI000871DD17|nr:FAD:protein FMN transferase [Pseudomonas aeruginosa]EKX2005257.1 FAD:protein FMN transferase [Pseudomonas aeruginosa]MCO5621230.1 FAD:protein FMN transferase [Pseudomonas aeruginosa]MCT5380429.1 FAD:protein FMN transferase [Pseudomonas aeruginosa]MCV0240367.1 FAD:protein FMN transferase [Pseudomonas aeruginosa]OFC29175.1 thiamine biosynthesis protein ApbE [Pseudomonas aeruginosa]
MAERFRPLAKAGLAALALVLAGCGDTLESFGGPTMGSTYSIKYVRGASAPDVQTAKAAVEAILAEVDRQMSTYRDDSLVSRFNALPAQSCMELPPPMLELLRYGGELSEQSQGAFDMTVEPLMNLWGFGPQARVEKVPSAEQIAAARRDVGHRHLRIDGQRLCKDAAVQLDFDSIAAGYTVDAVGERLKELGVRSYLAEITGELKAEGRKPDGTPWRIAIEAPREGQRVAQQVLALDGYGVSTSGDYRNYFEENGQRYSHTFDPRTGAPIDHHLASVTVIDPSTRNADGLSTLLMVLGPEEGYRFAEKHRLAALFVSRQGNGFDSRTTPRYEQLFGNQGERP